MPVAKETDDKRYQTCTKVWCKLQLLKRREVYACVDLCVLMIKFNGFLSSYCQYFCTYYEATCLIKVLFLDMLHIINHILC